jgi:MazG family protein
MADPDGGGAAKSFGAFVDLIARLRGPGGCPWDREQTHESLKPMTIEEAYEVLEAIDRADDEHLAGELGDLLLQVVFHAQIAAEAGRFTIRDVIERVAAKMVRRHPHVFGGARAETPGEVLRNWEAIKQAEQEARGGAKGASMLDSVGSGLPAVMEAYQMTTKVSRVGFDWASVPAVLEKLEEEHLFPRFERAGTQADLVGVLRKQHQAGRQLTATILERTTAAAAAKDASASALAETLGQFVRMYRAHEAREDTVLFPAFRDLVSKDEYERLGEAFESQETKVLGEKGYERIVGEVAQIERTLGIYELASFTPRL